jgi:nitrogen-specific signal transduction histidine kinase
LGQILAPIPSLELLIQNQLDQKIMEPTIALRENAAESEQAAEINNALAVILGNAQLLLLQNTVSPEDRAKLKAIEQSSVRIQCLVEGMIQSKKPASF